MIASTSGNRKNIPICLKSALFNSCSSTPILLSILNFSALSLDSDNSFNAKMAAQEIQKILPKYNPKKVTTAPKPILASLISCFVFNVTP